MLGVGVRVGRLRASGRTDQGKHGDGDGGRAAHHRQSRKVPAKVRAMRVRSIPCSRPRLNVAEDQIVVLAATTDGTGEIGGCLAAGPPARCGSRASAASYWPTGRGEFEHERADVPGAVLVVYHPALLGDGS